MQIYGRKIIPRKSEYTNMKYENYPLIIVAWEKYSYNHIHARYCNIQYIKTTPGLSHVGDSLGDYTYRYIF